MVPETLYRFPAELSALPAIMAHIGSVAGHFDEAAMHRAQTAVEELFLNSVQHGFRDAMARPDIALSVSVVEGRLQVRYEDGFLPFDPFLGLDDAMAHVHQPLAQRPVGGLGRLIVRGLADEVRYVYEDRRNRIDLSFAVRPAALPHDGPGDLP